MPKGKMLVYSNPASPEREAEFNEWYDTVHVPDVLKIEGIVAATRFKVSDSPPADAPGTYLAIYDVEADDFTTVMDGLASAFAEGRLPMSDSLQPGPIIFIELVTDTVRA